jgi:hypothetical protein
MPCSFAARIVIIGGSKRTTCTPYRSALSMLTFYINRAGKSLRWDQRRVLERAKRELRRAFGRL